MASYIDTLRDWLRFKIAENYKGKDHIISDLFERYTGVSGLDDGLNVVLSKGGRFGYINEFGEEIVPCKFKDIKTKHSSIGILVVQDKHGQWGVINGFAQSEDEVEIVPFGAFAMIYDFTLNGIARVVYHDGSKGLIDLQGTVIAHGDTFNI
ncbi:MAG: hypothetical protein E7374_02825 [Clostridiales bacterium]|nr:hypothetical protein [Clostridiales bacterium]